MKALLAGLVLAYPLLIHFAVSRHSAALMLTGVALLAVVFLLPGLVARRRGAWLALPLVVLALVALARADAAMLVLYAPPVLANVFLAWLFGHTLRAGSTPLIRRLVDVIHPSDHELDPGIPAYARRLTALWFALFVVLALVNLVLALLATPGGILLALGVAPPVTVPVAAWAWFSNVGCWLLVGALFGVEYVVRQRLFPNPPYRNFADFTRRLVAVGPRLWRDAIR